MATNSLLNTSTGTTGQLLAANTSSAPTFVSSLSADFTFTSSTASQTRTVTVSNTDNTAAATSSANLQITVGGANVGDPRVTYTVTGANSWTKGIDNSDSDLFKLSASTALGTTDTLKMSTAGERVLPLQPAFLADPSVQINDVTGDGTVYTIIWDQELFDQSSDYDPTTGTFTAPVTGRYNITAGVSLLSLAVGMTSGVQQIVTSNRTYSANFMNWFTGSAGNSRVDRINVFADVDAADTVVATIQISGGTKVVDIQARGAIGSNNFFGGFLVC